MPVITRSTASSLANGMRVIEANQPLTIRTMQCQGVIEPVRLLRRDWHPPDDEPDPMTTLWVDHENLPVQIEQRIESGIMRRRHVIWLSQ